MPDASGAGYNEVLYPGFALAQAHPDRLATLAILLGMHPAPVQQCRLLEIGCGDGTNLISVALGLPNAQCVGIDLAPAGIDKGNAAISELGLRNITLQTLDLMELGVAFGRFDFIVAHGLYSWVPEPVRDKLLRVCSENLQPNGVAYVSYNTYPGAHLRNTMREMMRFHVRETTEPAQRVAEARSLAKFLAAAAKSDDGVYPKLLQREQARISGFSDSALFHDDLSEHDAPVYFHEFVEHASRHGLKYLAEAEFFEMQAGIFGTEVVEQLNEISGDLIAKEQYLDFLKGRRFRQTLLCHADCQLDYSLNRERLATLFIASPLRCDAESVDLRPGTVVRFSGPKGSSIATDNPVIKAALRALAEVWPQSLPFGELLRRARSACGREGESQEATAAEDARALGDLLLRGYAAHSVELHVCQPRFATRLSTRPEVSPLARLQSRTQDNVTTLRHRTIAIEDELARRLIQLIDGSRDRDALLDGLMALIESGDLTVESRQNDKLTADEIRIALAAELERNLAQLAQHALLVARQ